MTPLLTYTNFSRVYMNKRTSYDKKKEKNNNDIEAIQFDSSIYLNFTSILSHVNNYEDNMTTHPIAFCVYINI